MALRREKDLVSIASFATAHCLHLSGFSFPTYTAKGYFSVLLQCCYFLFLGVQQPGSVHQIPSVLLCLVSGMKRSCHVGQLAGEGRLGSWLYRDPKQPWGLADPGRHLTWVRGAQQVLGEQAESQT